MPAANPMHASARTNRHSVLALCWLLGAAAPSATQAAPSEPTDTTIEDHITVTAQKRTQPIREVPFGVDVIARQELDIVSAGAQDILFLAARSPSLYAESSSGRTFPRFYIRGLGNSDFDLNANQPVALVYDDVVLENAILKGFPVFDTERVEVIRGPQSTLFGRNTPAGVVQFRSVKPSMKPDGYLRASYGRFDTIDVEGAYGAPVIEGDLAARIAFQYQERDDFVNNTFRGGGEEGFEKFEDFAGRLQFLYTPRADFSALLNIHGRNLNGGSRLFRANILRPGTGGLTPSFRLRSTAQDATQILDVDTFGISLKLEATLPTGTLTSITAFERARITARGDVDGGFGADFAPPAGPGSIPFAAETADNIDGHHQITQELRYSFSSHQGVTSTVGAFLFYENLEIENLSFDTLAGGIVNGRAIQDQETTAWALFTNSEWLVWPRVVLGGGLRVSGEDKNFIAERLIGPFGAPALGPVRRTLHDTVVTGDVSARYRLFDDLTWFTRYARGFRAPAIQGRIVFGDAVTTAATETIDSLETGFKSSFWNGRLHLNGTAYYFVTNDQQLTAVGGAGNFNQLLNADRARGHGGELDAYFTPSPHLRVTAGYSYNATRIDDDELEVAVCAIACNVLDPVNPLTGNARIDGNPLPQAPRHIANLTFRYGLPRRGGAGEWFLFTDLAYRSRVNFFLYRSAEFRGNDLAEVGMRAGYVSREGRYEAAAFGRNIFDARVVNGGIDFNNFSGFVNDPAVWGVELLMRF